MDHKKFIRAGLGATAVGLFLLVLLLLLLTGWGAVQARGAGAGTEAAYLPLIMRLHSPMATATPTVTNTPTATSTPSPTNTPTPTFTPTPTATPGIATIRVSIASDGKEGNDSSRDGSISAAGRYVAFESDASNLVVGDANGQRDIFVHDLQTGQTNLISVASDGTQGNARSRDPFISADGRYVLFGSYATNLVSDDANGELDVFVYDRQTGQISRVSIASDGTEGNDSSGWPSISADGRYVFFDSDASNLVSDDTNNAWDIFVHDQQTGQTNRISIASDGTEGNDGSWDHSISADGRYVAFTSSATNLVGNDTNDMDDVFVYDRQTAQTNRVSLSSEGTEGNGISGTPAISADGRYVTFVSGASNLANGDTNSVWDVFTHDRQTGQTSRVSVASDGTQGNGTFSGCPVISADGRYIVFCADASNLVNGDTNDVSDVFIHDRQTGQTSRVSISSSGIEGNDDAISTSMSTDGRYVVFYSYANNLVEGDTNGVPDVFVHDRGE